MIKLLSKIFLLVGFLVVVLFLARPYLEKLYFKPQETIKEKIEQGRSEEMLQTIIVDSPKPNEVVKSPLIIKGKAKGNWFFEATFPVVLVDWDGKIISEGYVQAKGDWMTNNFVEFEGKLEFKNPAFPNTDINHFSHRGTLILKSSNPSGLPENQLSFEVPIIFE